MGGGWGGGGWTGGRVGVMRGCCIRGIKILVFSKKTEITFMPMLTWLTTFTSRN